MAATYVLSDTEHRFLDLDADVHHGAARRADARRVGRPLALEVAYGGLLGALVTLALFQVFA